MNNPKVAIIILNWNGKEDTLNCLESVKNLSYPHHEILLVDNGSTDGSVEAFITRNHPKTTIIKNDKNFGFAEGNNIGIKHAIKNGADYLLLLNNDTTVSPNLIEAFLSEISKHPNGAILGGKILSMKDPSHLDHLGGIWNLSKGTFELVGLHEKADNYKDSIELDYACGCVLFFPKEIIKKIGLLEKKFFLFWEEADFCMRAKRKNIPVVFTPDAVIQHKGSASFAGGKPHTEYYWWRNRFLFMERNLPKKDFLTHLIKTFIPEFFHNSKMLLIKSLDLTLRKNKLSPNKISEKQKKLILYKTRLNALSDYMLRRFEKGPDF